MAALLPLGKSKADVMVDGNMGAGGSADSSGSVGALFGPGPDGWWDSERVSSPRIIRRGDDDWVMWYYGRDVHFDRQIVLPTGRIGMATSSDGIHWNRVKGPLTMGAAFDPSTDQNRFDSGHVGVSDVHFRDGLYWMWYFGGDHRINDVLGLKVKGFPLRPGCAVSRDGLNWMRLDGPFRGALLDSGGPDDFDSFMAGWPQVIPWDDGTWRMYYHGMDRRQRYSVGWAESEDGLHWEKRGPVFGPSEDGQFDDLGVATRHIVKLNGQWTMFYEACQDTGSLTHVGRQIGLAVSEDGIAWERVRGPNENGSIIASSPEGSGRWDRRLGCPFVVLMDDGTLRLYYIGSSERSGESELDSIHQIGLAVSEGDITQWERWGEV